MQLVNAYAFKLQLLWLVQHAQTAATHRFPSLTNVYGRCGESLLSAMCW